MLEKHFSGKLNHIKRNSSAWQYDRYIPYPYHLNIGRLPKEVMWDCLSALIDVATQPRLNKRNPQNFQEWLINQYGKGICEHFMEPYNYKVWAYNTSTLGYYWVKERIAEVNLKELVKTIIYKDVDDSWGPNGFFTYPKQGGIGNIWSTLSNQLPQDNVHYNKQVSRIDTSSKKVYFEDGSLSSYDVLISTIPIVELVSFAQFNNLVSTAKMLKYSSVHVIGLGIKGDLPAHLKDKSWLYFPGQETPCYRVTILSNYSKHNVPDGNYYSLLCEVSESTDKPVNSNEIVTQVVEGCKNTRLINDGGEIVSHWYHKASYGYPTPTVDRNDILQTIQPSLMEKQIYARGRFGAWCYEISNQDHTFMQGVEVVDKILTGKEETTWKLF